MCVGGKKIDDDGWRIFHHRNKAVKQEHKDETVTNEKRHAPGGCRFSHRHRGQYHGGVWIRPNNDIQFWGFFW